MRYLVTGGGGQLGRAFAKLYPEAVVLARSELDITDREGVEAALERARPEVIVNAAAFTQVDAAEAQPDLAALVNVEAVIRLAQAAKRAGAMLVQISTDYVFAGDKKGPYTENDRTRPLSVYGRTKLQSEMAARAAGGKSLIIRTSWVYGEGKNFVASILDAAKRRDSLDVVDDQRGRPTNALDLAGAIVTLLENGASGLVHVTGGGEAGTWADVAETVIEAAELPTQVRRVTTAQYYAGKSGPVATRPANSELDCSLAASVGVKLRPWEEAVTAYVRKKLESD